jgi:hypothetical protein
MDTLIAIEIESNVYNVYKHVLSKNSGYFKAILEDENDDILKIQCLDIKDKNIWMLFLKMIHQNKSFIDENIKTDYLTLYTMSNYFCFNKFNQDLQLLTEKITKSNIKINNKLFNNDDNARDLVIDYSDLSLSNDESNNESDNNESDEEKEELPMYHIPEDNDEYNSDISKYFTNKTYNSILLLTITKYLFDNGKIDELINIFKTNIEIDTDNLLNFYNVAKDNLDIEEFSLLSNIISTCLNFKEENDNLLLHDIFKYKHNYVDRKPKQISPFIKYKQGEPTTVKTLDIFKENLIKFTFGIINEDFIWNNIVLSGGAILHCLTPKPNKYSNSDVDLWIYGKTEEERQEKFTNILKYFDKYETFYGINHNVITIIIRNIKRNFQVILTNYETKYKVIEEFDMTHIQSVYDGENVLGTTDFILSLKTQITKIINKDNIKPYRVAKAYNLGYSFNNDDVEDYYTIYEKHKENILCKKNKYLYINDEPEDRISYLMRKLLGSKLVCSTLKELHDNFVYNAKFTIMDYDLLNEYFTNIDENTIEDVSFKNTFIEKFRNTKVNPFTRTLRLHLKNVYFPVGELYSNPEPERSNTRRILANLNTTSVETIKFFEKLNDMAIKNLLDNKDNYLNKKRRYSSNHMKRVIEEFRFYKKESCYNRNGEMEIPPYITKHFTDGYTDQFLKIKLKCYEDCEIVDKYGDKIKHIPKHSAGNVNITIEELCLYDNRQAYMTIKTNKIQITKIL